MSYQETNTSSYIIESLRDAILVLQAMMGDLSPRRYYTVAEIAEVFGEFSQNKVFRIIKTFESIGWVEKHPSRKAYKVGHQLLFLSHLYFAKLHEEIDWYRQEILSFDSKQLANKQMKGFDRFLEKSKVSG